MNIRGFQYMYKIIQGIQFKLRVYSRNSILIIKDETSVLTFNNVIEDNQDNSLWLSVLIDQNNFMAAGTKQYQLFEDNNIKQYGALQVVASLLVDPEQDLRGRYAIIVDAIEANLAGIATTAQKHVQAGDKTIDSYSAAQLLSLLSYFKGKLKEQESQEEGSVNPSSDQMLIKYKFTIR